MKKNRVLAAWLAACALGFGAGSASAQPAPAGQQTETIQRAFGTFRSICGQGAMGEEALSRAVAEGFAPMPAGAPSSAAPGAQYRAGSTPQTQGMAMLAGPMPFRSFGEVQACGLVVLDVRVDYQRDGSLVTAWLGIPPALVVPGEGAVWAFTEDAQGRRANAADLSDDQARAAFQSGALRLVMLTEHSEGLGFLYGRVPEHASAALAGGQ